MKEKVFITATVTLAAAAAHAAGPIEVIYSEAPGHPTAQVPGAVGLDGEPIKAEFKALEILTLSPDGSMWILKGRNHGGTDVETMLLLGSGTEGEVFAQEGQPVHDGEPGELYDFFGSGPAHFNELNQFVYTARARGGDFDTKHKGIFYDGTEFHLVRAESDPALGLVDLPPNPSGDELFGNSFGSMHVQNDGTIGYQDTTIKNLHSSRRPALFYGDEAFKQVGVHTIEASTWDNFDANEFFTTPDGMTWYAQGDDLSGIILAVNDEVVLREGTAVGGSEVILADIFGTDLLANGDWLSRGDDPSDNDWAVRNGELIAKTGDPVIGSSDENWGAVFLAVTGNTLGDWVLAGNTDNLDIAVDQVVVLNGVEVVAREGDPVDLDGNGEFDDDAFIGRGSMTASAFHADDFELTDDGWLYFFASLRNAAGEDLGEFGTGGDAFLRVRVIEPAECPEDIDGDGSVGFADLIQLLSAWGPCPGCAEDIDGDDTVGFSDLIQLLSAWGPCE